jgi:hypothetical protein
VYEGNSFLLFGNIHSDDVSNTGLGEHMRKNDMDLRENNQWC